MKPAVVKACPSSQFETFTVTGNDGPSVWLRLRNRELRVSLQAGMDAAQLDELIAALTEQRDVLGASLFTHQPKETP